MKANSQSSGKNFRDLAGKPLFKWIQGTLLAIDQIDEVVINTDACDLLLQHGIANDSRIKLRHRKESTAAMMSQ